MPDEFFTQNPTPQFAAPHYPEAIQRSGRRSGAGRAIIAAALLAFIAGAGAVSYFAWQGSLPFSQTRTAAPTSPARTPLVAPPAPAPPVSPSAETLARAEALDTRMAALEQRLDAVDVHADAASGNAARAEALLIAFAARRALDRGAPLGFLEDQLRLRFGDAQPNAVATVIETARAPVTVDQLVAGLDTLAPSLTEAPVSDGAWSRIKREMSNLFVIRHDSVPSPAPTVMLGRARALLEAGKTEEAITEVQHLPGAAGATEWMTAARRFDAARRALDLLETTALLDTRGLKDSGGAKVDQPSPIVPTPEANGGAR